MSRRASTRVLVGVVGLIVLACLQAGAGFAQGVSSYSEPTGTLSVGVAAVGSRHVNCPSGDVVLDGGYYQPLTDIYITQSAPSNSSGAGWSVSVNNLTGQAVVGHDVCGLRSIARVVFSADDAVHRHRQLHDYLSLGHERDRRWLQLLGFHHRQRVVPVGLEQWSLTYTFSSGSISDDAVCARAPDGYIQESGTTGQYPGLVNVPCPSGTVVIGGGGNEGPDSAQNPGGTRRSRMGQRLKALSGASGAGIRECLYPSVGGRSSPRSSRRRRQ